MTLLQIVQAFCQRTGLPSPAVVVAATDPGVIQMLGLLQEELEEAMARGQWQELNQITTFTAALAEDQGTLTTIFGTPNIQILNDTIWNRTTRLPIFGPISPQDWEALVALPTSGTLYRYRIRQNHLYILPAPSSADTLAAEWKGPYAIRSSLDAAQVYFLADTDTCLYPDAQMIASLRWRWKREKGLSYAEDKLRYEGLVAQKLSTTATAPVLSLNGGQYPATPWGRGAFDGDEGL